MLHERCTARPGSRYLPESGRRCHRTTVVDECDHSYRSLARTVAYQGRVCHPCVYKATPGWEAEWARSRVRGASNREGYCSEEAFFYLRLNTARETALHPPHLTGFVLAFRLQHHSMPPRPHSTDASRRTENGILPHRAYRADSRWLRYAPSHGRQAHFFLFLDGLGPRKAAPPILSLRRHRHHQNSLDMGCPMARYASGPICRESRAARTALPWDGGHSSMLHRTPPRYRT